VDMSESSHHARLYANILKVPVEVSIQGGARLHHVGHDSYARGSRSPCSDVGFGGHVQCSVCQTFHIVVGSMESGQLNAFHISVFVGSCAQTFTRGGTISLQSGKLIILWRFSHTQSLNIDVYRVQGCTTGNHGTAHDDWYLRSETSHRSQTLCVTRRQYISPLADFRHNSIRLPR
jgi:hypothetical protein